MGAVGVARVNFDNAVASAIRHLGLSSFPLFKVSQGHKANIHGGFPNLDMSQQGAFCDSQQ
jgi:hypothetical protein